MRSTAGKSYEPLTMWNRPTLNFDGWASEKMPWMVVEMALPFAILAGIAIVVADYELALAGKLPAERLRPP